MQILSEKESISRFQIIFLVADFPDIENRVALDEVFWGRGAPVLFYP
jgi:hypothetical protein